MEQLSVKQIMVGAKFLGALAFKAGKPRTPAQDKACLDLIARNNSRGIVILTYWCKGWDAANLAAPVVGL